MSCLLLSGVQAGRFLGIRYFVLSGPGHWTLAAAESVTHDRVVKRRATGYDDARIAWQFSVVTCTSALAHGWLVAS